MKKPIPTVTLTITADGDFDALVDATMYEGVLDRDGTGFSEEDIKWKRGYKPKAEWTRQAIFNAASYLVGLTPRVAKRKRR